MLYSDVFTVDPRQGTPPSSYRLTDWPTPAAGTRGERPRNKESLKWTAAATMFAAFTIILFSDRNFFSSSLTVPESRVLVSHLVEPW